MSFEIDFLPVDQGEALGDAIVWRYGPPGRQKVIVYDAGTIETGEALVQHIQRFFQTSRIDHLVSSHPDPQHTPGLQVLLEKMEVGCLWLHQPWLVLPDLAQYFATGEVAQPGLAETFETKFRASFALATLAAQKGVPIKTPFRGQWIGNFHVLSPSQDWYEHTLVTQFRQPIASPNHLMRFLRCLRRTAKRAVSWVAEQWDSEYLPETGHTSAENESSVVLYGNLEDYYYGILFTGHAGVEALHRSVDYLAQLNIDPLKHLQFIQMPHYGSLEHVSSALLDRLFGAPLAAEPAVKRHVAFISSPKPAVANYPHPSVVNALLRRGVKVIATEGKTKRHQKNTQPSAEWKVSEKLAFSDAVMLESTR